MNPEGTPLIRGYLPNGELEMFTSLEHYITTMIDLERKEAEEARAGMQQSSDIPQKEETPPAAGVRIYVPPGTVIPGVPFPPQTVPSCSDPNHAASEAPKEKPTESKNMFPEQRCDCEQCEDTRSNLRQYLLKQMFSSPQSQPAVPGSVCRCYVCSLIEDIYGTRGPSLAMALGAQSFINGDDASSDEAPGLEPGVSSETCTNPLCARRIRNNFADTENERYARAEAKFEERQRERERKRLIKFQKKEAKILSKKKHPSETFQERKQLFEARNVDKTLAQRRKWKQRQNLKYQKHLDKFEQNLASRPNVDYTCVCLKVSSISKK